jgi:diguanylate cyclase (GGDEF)-like protein
MDHEPPRLLIHAERCFAPNTFSSFGSLSIERVVRAANRHSRTVRASVAAALLLLTTLTLVSFAALTSMNRLATDLSDSRVRLFNNAWQVRYLDEVLTHSVAEYILSDGDIVWKDRYNAAVVELDAVLLELKSTNASATTPIDAVSEANTELVRLEVEAFSATDFGDTERARALLSGNYQDQKRQYQMGIDKLFEQERTAIDRDLARTVKLTQWLRFASLLPGFTLAVAVLMIGRFSLRASRMAAERDDERENVVRAQNTEQRIAQAFDLAQNEAEVLVAVREVLRAELLEGNAEVLLADSSRSHLKQALSSDAVSLLPGCSVATPRDCPAIRRGFAMTFDDPTSYASCPHLRIRDVDGCQATCVPVSLMGQSVGVIHSVSSNQLSVEHREENQRLLNRLATQIGDRVGVMRTLDQTQMQAATDPLTGLLNRRSLENRAADILGFADSYSVALFDLDHFKSLNDTHGHATGDQAIRVFAKTLRDSLRTTDLICRWGGEEFLVVLPGSDLGMAQMLSERVRETLARSLLAGTVPDFTTSAGVAQAATGESLQAVVARADTALLQSKSSGRNQVSAG